MKQVFTLLLTLNSLQLFSQDLTEQRAAQILDSVLNRAQEISLYNSNVNWDSLRLDLHKQTSGASSLAELKPAFENLFNELGDKHGNIRTLPDYSILANLTDSKNVRTQDDRHFDQEAWAVVNNVDSRFESEILDDDIGYLKVVGIGGNIDGQSEAERIRSALLDLSSKGIKKWILDFRYNGGGNINVMMAGLAPLFDTTLVLSVQNLDGETQGLAEIRHGNFYYFEINAFPMQDSTSLKNQRIAVLTSRWTVSSGEMLAIGLKGQKNVKFFGERSGGLTTNNSWDVFDNQIVLSLSTGVFCDRNGIQYDQFVEIDQKVEFQIEKNHSMDTGIQAATQWLKKGQP